MYDYLIVGAGVAGLYTAFNLSRSYPKKKICIIESSGYIGGRLHSIKYDNIIVDGGGARFNTQQYRVVSLVKELDLMKKTIPINNIINYKSINPKYDISLETLFPTIDSFIIFLKKYIKKNKITNIELINTTILKLVDDKINKIYPTIQQYLIDIYPYYSELGVLNALEAINLFTNEFSETTKYMIINGGMEQIASILHNKLSKNDNVEIYKECPLEKIEKIEKKEKKESIDSTPQFYEIICKNGSKSFTTYNLILAIPKNKLLQIHYLTNNKSLLYNINSVQNEPLYRIFARYPLDKKTNKVWFDNMKKISTNLPIKYILPINYKKGVIMISYTDSKFANYWNKHLISGNFETILNKQLKELFPTIDIPKAKWYKHCYWVSGAGYWRSGYDREKIASKMIQPIENENLFICGENYSSHQAWVEGALETSNLVLSKLGIHIKYIHKNNIKKVKQIITKNNTKNNTKINTTLDNSISKNKMITQKKTKPIKKTNKTQKKPKKSITVITPIHSNSNSKKSMQEYTLEEVAKHNKKSDAWIIINNKVSDVTKWIPSHPGGDIIMKGVGKDATTLFNSVGHDEYAKKLVKKYQIGILKK